MSRVPFRTIILTGVYDDLYISSRKDNPIICTSAGKRAILYRAIEEAVGSPLLLLSPQPNGQGKAEFLNETITRFAGQNQLFSRASGIRKVRFFNNFIHYALHVAKHSRDEDTLIIDNYELIYVLAVYYCRLLGRKNTILLEYEDGKHLIDRGVYRWMSGLAERLARPLVKGALLATPTLSERLPRGIPNISIPGILREGVNPNYRPANGEPVGFLYSGSLDIERGIPLLLDYLENGQFVPKTVFHITGHGHFKERFVALQKRYPTLIYFHGSVSEIELSRIRSACHFGFNLQSSQNPISNVTYPSKTFDYLNAGIRVISTKAAGVEIVLGEAAIYLMNETIEGLSDAIQKAHLAVAVDSENQINLAIKKYTFDGTVKRLRHFFKSVNPSSPS